MPIWLAYWSVVFIWATTPISVASSNHSLHFLEAGGLRMIFASLLMLVVCRVLKKPLFPNRIVLKSYFVASIGLFPNMALVYWGAQHVPSGVISVMFAFNPVVIGLLSWLILKDNPFSPLRIIALGLSVIGMGVIYADQLQISQASSLGILALITAVIGWSFSTIYLVKMDIKVDPLCQTAGASMFAIPGYLVAWLILDGDIPRAVSWQSVVGVSYLSVFGSVVGFSLYFYILTRLPVMSISLITLLSPVFALSIGAVFADETISIQLAGGSGIVLLSLLLYQLTPVLKRWSDGFRNQSSSSSGSGGQ